MHSNAQSHDVTINLIREVVERGYKVKQVGRALQPVWSFRYTRVGH
jgi:hypothetical protein